MSMAVTEQRYDADTEVFLAPDGAWERFVRAKDVLAQRIETYFKDAGLVQDVVTFITGAKDRPLCLPRSDADDE